MIRTISLSSLLLSSLVAVACSSSGQSEPTTPAAAAEPAAAEPTTEPAEPSAQSIIDAYIEASGGVDARKEKDNYHATGSVSIQEMGITGTIDLWAARPQKLVTEMELQGMGTTESGTNGDVVWEKSAMTGSRIVTGDEAAHILRASTFNAELQWDELYQTIELVGEAEFNDRPTWKLAFHTVEGTVEHHYFDRETDLLVGSEATIKSQMGELHVVSRMGDYREVAGLKMPFSIEEKVVNATIVTDLDSIEFDVEIPEGTFEVPEDIAKLQDKQARTE